MLLGQETWCIRRGESEIEILTYLWFWSKKGVMGEIEELAEHKLASQPIVAWDWNRDKLGLACCATLEQQVKVVVVTKLDKC